MAVEPPRHDFDDERAARFRPRERFTKIAVLVETDPEARTVIRTGFGEQTMRGAFYAVADGNASYGAAREEFERTHERIGGHEWVKRATVLAYRAADAATVSTIVRDHHETTVVARAGDWIVRQAGGEVMVLEPEAFEARYAPVEATP